MKTTNRERQRKWRQKKMSSGMRTVTVMLPSHIKDLIDSHRRQTGATMAQVIETAVANLLSAKGNSDPLKEKNKSKQYLKSLSLENMQQMSADLNAIAARFEKLAGYKGCVTCNTKPVTNSASALEKAPAQDPLTAEIYRLVRLLNNMEVSVDEIAVTLNKRKFKTLSGAAEWNASDVQAVLEDIHQKYGHINPLFSISHQL